MNDISNMQVPDRLREAFSGGGARKISQVSGVPVGTVQSILAGSLPRADTLVLLSKASGRSVDWLLGLEVDEPAGSSFPAVPRYDVALSAGHGSFIERAELLDHIPFTAEFFARRLGHGPAGMVIVDARGDSMEPTISDRDLVMVDTSDIQLAPAIWAFALEDAILVKRLNPTPAGLEIVSDNPLYGRQLLDAQHQDAIRLIGRVVWVGRVL